MLTSKQRAYLRGLGNPLDTILMVGKGGMNGQIIKQADDALTARELIKGTVLQNSPMTARDAIAALCEGTNAEPVQCIGNRLPTVLTIGTDALPDIRSR